jgi:cytochrome c oxidase subunit IV
MKVEGWLFAAGFFFFAIAAVVYGLVAEEPVGIVALAFTAGLSFLVGYYLLFTARRIDVRPEDRQDAEIAEGAGELGFYSPHSWWPLVAAFFGAVAFTGIAVGWWLFLLGAGGGAFAVIGLVFEYYRGDPAH